MFGIVRQLLVVVVMSLSFATIMSHSCDYNTCVYACYGLGQQCVSRCYDNCMNNLVWIIKKF